MSSLKMLDLTIEVLISSKELLKVSPESVSTLYNPQSINPFYLYRLFMSDNEDKNIFQTRLGHAYR